MGSAHRGAEEILAQPSSASVSVEPKSGVVAMLRVESEIIPQPV